MNELRIPVGDAAAVRLHKVAGDLYVKSWNEQDIGIAGNQEYALTVEGDEIVLRCNGDCTLSIPSRLSLRFGHVAGDALIANVATTIEGRKLGGDLRLAQTGSVAIDSVAGDAIASGCTGDLHIRAVGGDLRVESLAGDLNAGVGGDLEVSDSAGRIAAHTGGDASLRFGSMGHSGEATHAVQAGGNIECRLPAGANATLNLQYGGTLHIGDQHTRHSEGSHLSRLVLGTGEIVVTLMAGGDIRLTNGDIHGGELDDLANQMERSMHNIAGSLESQLADMANQLGTHLGELGYADAIAARVQEKIQRAMSRAEAKIEKAMRQAERQAERQAQRQAVRAQRRTNKVQAVARQGQANEQRVKPPVSDEERAAVLRMLEEGKISLDQAEMLLSAMEA